jgi:hypothetical protein
MDDVKIGEILLPGDEDTQQRQEQQVKAKFWPTMKRAVRRLPFSRDVVAAFYCATDPRTSCCRWMRCPISWQSSDLPMTSLF